jgi:hypothetical protein
MPNWHETPWKQFPRIQFCAFRDPILQNRQMESTKKNNIILILFHNLPKPASVLLLA